MKKGLFTVTENSSVADRTLRMTLAGDASAIVRPGQFVNVRDWRAASCAGRSRVCDWDGRARSPCQSTRWSARGTRADVPHCAAGAALDLLTGLGNGY